MFDKNYFSYFYSFFENVIFLMQISFFVDYEKLFEGNAYEARTPSENAVDMITSEGKPATHDEQPTFRCSQCDFAETTDKSEIIEHIFENHQVNDDTDEDQQLDEIVKFLIVSCKSCAFIGTYSEYNLHVSI